MTSGVLPAVGDELLLSVPQTEQVLARVEGDGFGFYDLKLLEAPTTPRHRLERLALMIEFINDEGVARLHGRLDAPRHQPGGGDASLVRFAHRGSPQLLKRREHVRAAVTLPVDFRAVANHDGTIAVDQEVVPAQTIDLSGGGLLADGLRSPIAGQVLAFSLKLEGGEQVDGLCEIVRLVDQAKAGLRFTELDPGAQQRLEKLSRETARNQRRRIT